MANSPPGVVDTDVAAYDARHPGVDIPAARKAERWRELAPKLTPAERERYIAAGILSLHEAKPETVMSTATTRDGREIQCEYAIVDEDFARRWNDGRTRGHIAHAGWLVRRARTSLPARRPRCAPRTRGAGRPRAQAARSSQRSGDSGDSDPSGSSPRHPESRGAA